jgi:short-chain fatty acids transporter
VSNRQSAKSLRLALVFERFLPGQFGIAFLITLLVMLLVWGKNGGDSGAFATTLVQWQRGFWDSNLMVFTLQMALILIFGYGIAISPGVFGLLDRLARIPANGVEGAVITGLISMILAWLNWGLGLVAGAIYARMVAYALGREGKPFNYPLIGAAGYSGMMIWHSGLSGSATLKVAEEGHLKALIGERQQVPDVLPVSDTIFSFSNVMLSVVVLLVVLVLLRILAKISPSGDKPYEVSPMETIKIPDKSMAVGAEILEFRKWPALVMGFLLLVYLMLQSGSLSLDFFTPNVVITLLLAVGLLIYGSLRAYMLAIDRSVQSASGVLLLFPFYFGIIGMLRYSGLTSDITHWIVAQSGQSTFPMVVFVSSALVNLLIPSGGGQWAVQCPILVEASLKLGVPLEKVVLAFAYGDQLTNMLQPFWAIPLLYITRLKAAELIGYTSVIMLSGLIVFSLGILLSL